MDQPVSSVLREIAPPGGVLPAARVESLVARACPAERCRNRRVLLIVPDATRTAPVGLVFKALFGEIGPVAARLDVMVALGTHPPMSEAAICQRLEITQTERRDRYGNVRFFNHAWDDPQVLQEVGTIPAEDISRLTGGLFSMEVPVEINRRLFEYDQLIIVGPVFPHEVVGFSGGNKYLFPGVAGPRILNFFHWLGAVVSNPMIIGNKWTPVRKVVDRAGEMVRVEKLCFCLVVQNAGLAGLFAGSPESAWNEASDLSGRLHIVEKEKPFQAILSCAPPMYDELWVGAKCMYKLEPVLADGGELIIFAPHIREISLTHGQAIRAVGYHCRDYFLKQWDRFKGYPWGVLAHATHVFGQGTYQDGKEIPRARITLATGIPEETCRLINLGYRDPDSIRVEDWADREEEGVLLVRKAGEMLYRLRHPPVWAGGSGL